MDPDEDIETIHDVNRVLAFNNGTTRCVVCVCVWCVCGVGVCVCVVWECGVCILHVLVLSITVHVVEHLSAGTIIDPI